LNALCWGCGLDCDTKYSASGFGNVDDAHENRVKICSFGVLSLKLTLLLETHFDGGISPWMSPLFLELMMPNVKMKSGKMKKFPYTKKGMAAAKKAAGKKGSTMKRGKRSYG
jgi:hypothetical protein